MKFIIFLFASIAVGLNHVVLAQVQGGNEAGQVQRGNEAEAMFASVNSILQAILGGNTGNQQFYITESQLDPTTNQWNTKNYYIEPKNNAYGNPGARAASVAAAGQNYGRPQYNPYANPGAAAASVAAAGQNYARPENNAYANPGAAAASVAAAGQNYANY